MEKSLIINAVGNESTNTGKKYQKSITNVNPNVSNEIAGEFARRANALTTNVYGNALVIKKMDASEEETISLNADTAHYTGGECTPTTISGGLRLTFGENNYIDVTY